MQRQSATTLLALLVGCAVIPATHAYSVNVVSSQPVTRQIMPELATIQGIMEEMVRMQTATAQPSPRTQKTGHRHCPDGQATRQQMIFSNETHRLEEARKASACRTPSAVNPRPALQQKAAGQQRLQRHV